MKEINDGHVPFSFLFFASVDLQSLKKSFPVDASDSFDPKPNIVSMVISNNFHLIAWLDFDYIHTKDNYAHVDEKRWKCCGCKNKDGQKRKYSWSKESYSILCS